VMWREIGILYRCRNRERCIASKLVVLINQRCVVLYLIPLNAFDLQNFCLWLASISN